MKNNLQFKEEIEQIKDRYDRRNKTAGGKYSPLKIDVVLRKQEFERSLVKILRDNFSYHLDSLKLLEVGCGSGINLLGFIELGFNPENLTGIDLLQERVNKAKQSLPSQVEIIEGDALKFNCEPESFDIVFQSTVFTSILNEEFKKELADKMWTWVKTGGGILWYDFIYNNPSNPDVKGISFRKIKALFPKAEIYSQKISLAPPLGRFAGKISPSLYNILGLLPFLRTHVLCWMKKI